MEAVSAHAVAGGQEWRERHRRHFITTSEPGPTVYPERRSRARFASSSARRFCSRGTWRAPEGSEPPTEVHEPLEEGFEARVSYSVPTRKLPHYQLRVHPQFDVLQPQRGPPL